jgi:acyl-homoserine-lactone acylase
MVRRPHRWPLAAVLIAACCVAGLVPAAASAAKPPAYRVQIQRTTGGIPHITAHDWGSLGYGDGYAFAQDNLCTLADAFVTVNGERSRYFAPGDNELGFPAGSPTQNLESDFFWQRVKDQKVVEKLIAQKPPLGPEASVKKVVAGYAAGYNRYLRSVGVNKLPDARCRGQKWVRPITAMDLYRRYYQLAMYASSGQSIVLDGLIAASPPAPGVHGRSTARAVSAPTGVDPAALGRALGDTPDPQLGSNGVGLGGQATQSGGGMVLGNPHFPWRGGQRFYEHQLTIPGKIDVTGASLYGAPVVNIGHNRHVAWTHTVSTARRFVIHKLTLDPGDPTTYVVDGKPHKMKVEPVSVKVREGGTLVTKRHTFYETRYGLVGTLSLAGYSWTNANAYAIGDINSRNMRLLNVWYEMDRAKDVKGLVAAQSRTQGNPWVTTEASDDRGNTVFTEDSAIPNVSQAKMDDCMDKGIAQAVFAAAGVITLDGSRGVCDLGRDKGAVAPGILAPKHVPIVYRKDYVANSNDSYWMIHPSTPITGYAPIIGPTRTVQGLRTRLGYDMITKRIAGTDGLGAPKFSLPTLQAMWEGDRSLAAELTAPALAAACAAAPMQDGVDLTAACPVIAAYDHTGRATSKGGWLFVTFWSHLSGTIWKHPFDPAQPMTTPNTLNTSVALPALAAAVQELQAHHIPLDAPIGAVQHSTRHGRVLPIHGCDAGCYNVIDASRGDAADGPYGEAYYGSSFVMMADMRRSGPKAQAILTYSQSANPSSAHSGDQTELFSQRKWLPMLFTAKEIKGDPNLKTTRLKGR